MSSRYTHRRVLIVGGTTGIGLAAARRFLDEGARQVVVTGQDAERVRVAGMELGPRALAVQADVTDAADRAALARRIGEQGPVDVVFHNAGIAAFAPFAELDEATLDRTFDVNFKGAFLTLQALLPHLAKGGAVVLNTSINNQIGMPGSTAYAASKAALRSLARTLAAELLPLGVRVNAVSPGPVETPIYSKLGMPAEQLQQMAAQIVGNVPLGRFGTSEEIAAVVAWLASDDASFVVGTEVVADGGWVSL